MLSEFLEVIIRCHGTDELDKKSPSRHMSVNLLY